MKEVETTRKLVVLYNWPIVPIKVNHATRVTTLQLKQPICFYSVGTRLTTGKSLSASIYLNWDREVRVKEADTC